MIERILRKLGYINKEKLLEENYLLPKDKITYSNDLLYTYHNADFLNDKLFKESYKLAKSTDGGALLKNYDIEWRIHVLCWAASHAIHLDGDFVDCGVHTGIFARAVINYTKFENTSKKYFLLDTFSGLDERYSTKDELVRNTAMGYDKNDSEKLYQNVITAFEKFNVSIIKGAIPDTLSMVNTNKVSYLSIDMNSVVPELAALEFFWDKMTSGGIIVLDDYGYANSHTEQRLAHEAFAKSKNVKILVLPTCQGLLIKP